MTILPFNNCVSGHGATMVIHFNLTVRINVIYLSIQPSEIKTYVLILSQKFKCMNDNIALQQLCVRSWCNNGEVQ